MTRTGKVFKSPSDLMLMTISALAQAIGLDTFSDVAFMNRFANFGDWFK